MPGATPAMRPDPAQQRAAVAPEHGLPDEEVARELERTIEEQTKGFKPTGRSGEFRLESPEPFVFEGVSGTATRS